MNKVFTNTGILAGMIFRFIVRIVVFFAVSAGIIAAVYYACYLFGVVDFNQKKSEQSGLANVMQGSSAILGTVIGLWAAWYIPGRIFNRGGHSTH